MGEREQKPFLPTSYVLLHTPSDPLSAVCCRLTKQLTSNKAIVDGILQYGMVGFIGLALGSFLNSVTYRLPRGISIVRGRSMCVTCGKTLSWSELVPIVSFVVQRGKCTKCGRKISLKYPVVEVLSGLIIVALYLNCTDVLSFAANGVLALTLIAVALVDWEFLIIPDWILGIGFYLLFAIHALTDTDAIPEATLAAAGASLLLLAIRALGNRFFKRESMGLGDVKLGALLGFSFGFYMFLIVLWIAALLGASYGLSVKKQSQSNLIPFGSFLALSSIFVLFFADHIRQILEIWKSQLQ